MLENEDNRTQQFVADMSNARDVLESKASRGAFKILRKTYTAMVPFLYNPAAITQQMVRGVVNRYKGEWEDWFDEWYAESGVMIGPLQDDYTDYYVSSKNLSDLGYAQAMRDYARRIAGTKIVDINTTTGNHLYNIIRREVERGAEEGLSVDSIADNIGREMNGDLKRRYKSDGTPIMTRYDIIARTEITNASRQAQRVSAQASGLTFKRFWSTSGLPNIRESHLFAERWSYEQGGINDGVMFNMGNGNQLIGPGDPNGPAEEIILCRCTEIFRPQ